MNISKTTVFVLTSIVFTTSFANAPIAGAKQSRINSEPKPILIEMPLRYQIPVDNQLTQTPPREIHAGLKDEIKKLKEKVRELKEEDGKSSREGPETATQPSGGTAGDASSGSQNGSSTKDQAESKPRTIRPCRANKDMTAHVLPASPGWQSEILVKNNSEHVAEASLIVEQITRMNHQKLPYDSMPIPPKGQRVSAHGANVEMKSCRFLNAN